MGEAAKKMPETAEEPVREELYGDVIELPRGVYYIQRGFNNTEDGFLKNGGAFENADIINLTSQREVVYEGMKFIRKGRRKKAKKA